MTSKDLWYVQVLEGNDETDAHAYNYILDAVDMPGGEVDSVTACAKVLEMMCSNRMRLSFMVPPNFIRATSKRALGDGTRGGGAKMTAYRVGDGYQDTVGKPIGEPDENVVLYEAKSR